MTINAAPNAGNPWFRYGCPQPWEECVGEHCTECFFPITKTWALVLWKDQLRPGREPFNDISTYHVADEELTSRFATFTLTMTTQTTDLDWVRDFHCHLCRHTKLALSRLATLRIETRALDDSACVALGGYDHATHYAYDWTRLSLVDALRHLRLAADDVSSSLSHLTLDEALEQDHDKVRFRYLNRIAVETRTGGRSAFATAFLMMQDEVGTKRRAKANTLVIVPKAELPSLKNAIIRLARVRETMEKRAKRARSFRVLANLLRMRCTWSRGWLAHSIRVLPSIGTVGSTVLVIALDKMDKFFLCVYRISHLYMYSSWFAGLAEIRPEKGTISVVRARPSRRQEA